MADSKDLDVKGMNSIQCFLCKKLNQKCTQCLECGMKSCFSCCENEKKNGGHFLPDCLVNLVGSSEKFPKFFCKKCCDKGKEDKIKAEPKGANLVDAKTEIENKIKELEQKKSVDNMSEKQKIEIGANFMKQFARGHAVQLFLNQYNSEAYSAAKIQTLSVKAQAEHLKLLSEMLFIVEQTK